MNAQVLNLTVPEHVYSDEEVMAQVKEAIQREKKFKQGKMVHKSKIITAKKFLNSQMVNKICL